MFELDTTRIAEAVGAVLGGQYEAQRLQLQQDLIRTQCNRKGSPNRRIIAAKVVDGVQHTFHATKGRRKRRIAPAQRARR